MAQCCQHNVLPFKGAIQTIMRLAGEGEFEKWSEAMDWLKRNVPKTWKAMMKKTILKHDWMSFWIGNVARLEETRPSIQKVMA
jgi:hypothetical protein